ncbi:prepilin-type N-terminal cleavage/methylation domain-containing protein [Neisseria subflava]|uniref:PilX family type IV pilin n=1 Tax=Neisseria subflava TaxID=28449 RepID=UPI002029F247|nr:PilX family type IV pilin [Neisseria subflava]MCL9778453.1 prepilin-type N-terminal cleavage/methylation domain-containing protein [Neisseria subflava]UTG78165.1 prepilin-type N-terminal cleavage/methylation domain-containing protein [Neisseria subflava]
MNTSITKSQGFTLVEMLIVVAIIGILSTIAYPSYIHYIERGYQSQAHAELVAINSAFKNKMVKNPKLKTDEIKKFISSYKGHKDLADKYKYSAEMIDACTSRAYCLKAIPTKTGYTLSVWMDSLGNAYKCTDIDSANNFKTAMTNGKGCESVSKKKAS